MARPRIVLADDHTLILEGIRRLIEDKFEIVGYADNGKDLIRTALRLKPELIVLDVSMPILNGIDAMREIKKELPSTRFVFLSMHSGSVYVRKALEAGASAYVLKSGASEDLVHAIELARKGKFYFSPSLDSDVIETARSAQGLSVSRTLELTSRQRQILQLIAEGKQNKEIAGLIHVSVRTVEFHRSRLMSRLGARTVAELTRCAIREGLISPAE